MTNLNTRCIARISTATLIAFAAVFAMADSASAVPLLSPSDPIVAIDLDGDSAEGGAGETATSAIDGTLAKYFNGGGINSGFIVTPSNPLSIVTSFTITTANDAEPRDPASYSLFGTNDAITSTTNSTGTAESWTLISTGGLSLGFPRNTVNPAVSFANSTPYSSFRLIFPTVKVPGNFFQIAEVQFDGAFAAPIPEPSTAMLLVLGLVGFATRRSRRVGTTA